MSNTEILDDFSSTNSSNDKGLHLDDDMANSLSTAAKWGNILAIIGYIFVGFGILVGLFMVVSLGSMAFMEVPGMEGMMWVFWAFMLLYFAMLVLYILPMLYLGRFASNMKIALYNENQLNLGTAFENLGRLFKFLGIFTLVMIALYVIIYFVAGVMAVSMASSLQSF